MGKEGTKTRKERSDKKKDCKPTIPFSLYETFDRVSYITNNPIKTVAETILENSLSSDLVMDHFSEKFIRDYWFGDTLYIGNAKMEEGKIIRIPGDKAKVTMRLSKPVFYKLENFAYAIGKTTTSAAGQLLSVSSTETPILQRFVETSVMGELDGGRKKQLKEVLKFIHSHNPYAVEISMFSLLDMIVTRFRTGKNSLKDAIDDFIKKHE